MKSRIYSLEITVGNVTLHQIDQFDKIDAIVKFSSFEPFELFSKISTKSNAIVSPKSIAKEKSLVLKIDKRKCAIFSCSLQELHNLLLEVPLYIVLADRSQTLVQSKHPGLIDSTLIDSIQQTKSQFYMVGITRVLLNKLIYSLENPNQSYEEAKSNCVRGQFPIRNHFGHIVGHICLRVCLFCMPTKYSNLVDNRIPVQSTLHLEDNFETKSKELSPSELTEKEVQTLSQEMNNASDHWTQTEQRQQTNPYESVYEQLNHTPPAYVNTLASNLTKQINTGELKLTRSDFENLELGSFQPTGICFTRSNENGLVQSASSSSTVRKHLNVLNQPYLQTNMDQSQTVSSVEMNQTIVPNQETPAGDYPTLYLLLTELRNLKQKNSRPNSFISLEDVDHLVELLSGKTPVAQTVKTKKPFVQNNKCRQHLIGESNTGKRQARLRRLAVPRERPPPPGQLVPKDRGWLRSAPVYRGPTQCNLIPRLTLTHYLRLQHVKTKRSECLHSTPSVKCHHTKQSSVRFSHESDRTVKHVPRSNLITKSTERLAKPTDLEIFPSFGCNIGTNQLPGHMDKNLKISSNFKFSNPNLLSQDDLCKDSSNLACSSDSPDPLGQMSSEVTNAIQSDLNSSDDRSENFLAYPPVQSHLSPQHSLKKKFTNLPKHSECNSKYTRPGHIGDLTTAIQEHCDIFSQNSTYKGQHLDMQLPIQLKSSSELSKFKENSTSEEVENSYSEEFENTDEDTFTAGKDYMKSNTSKKSNERSQHEEHTSLSSHSSTSSSPSSSSSSKPPVQSNDTILDCTGPWTSFTAVTGLIELQPSQGTLDFPTDTNVEQHGLSESESPNDKAKSVVPNSANTQPDLSTLMNDINDDDDDDDVDNDLDIEKMRTRGSHDFILGGTVV